MGWSEKEGIGLTNKRSFALQDIEVRPKGLGLGAGFSAKKPRSDHSSSSNGATLEYAKGAFVEILSGKHENEVGTIVSFDDGMNRLIVKLANSNETVSLLQTFTRLLTRSDYDKATRYRK
jgi:hypothetical protein